MASPGSPRAVLFDFFGTLTQAAPRGDGHAAVARLLGCSPAELNAVLDTSFYRRSRGDYGDGPTTLRWVAAELGLRPDAETLRAAYRARVAALRADIRLRADAYAVLSHLRQQGVRIAVVSDCTHELTEILPTLPIAPLLDKMIFSVHIGAVKPDPMIYLAACAALRVEPRHCLYVGDGGSRELTGANAIGMYAIRLAAPDLGDHLVFRPDEEFCGPSARSLTEIFSPSLVAA
ncbi:putative hydrolase of the HAD superfamily [Hamadaea flava]|uniref:HAD family hydrolase n=1 Tax=Hamadaea flava TaxID=1742688 RepID=A0ABV8LIW9_9ACTN|nr:HAD family hydrolase [Hamadaea flava]MCP2325590.1 putative hydrolase of the HAD superfamily [Hamadaea flava]